MHVLSVHTHKNTTTPNKKLKKHTTHHTTSQTHSLARPSHRYHAGQERWLAHPGIDLLRGTGRLAGPCAVEVDGVPYTADHVVLATGAEPIIPPIRGLRELDGVWTSREATAMKVVPRRLLVLGGGRVGVELAQAVRRLGGEVVLIERSERVLPREAEPLGEASAWPCAATASRWSSVRA